MIRGGNPAPRGRYAPSPTGDLHLGNVSTALLAWLSIRGRGGRFVMRIEDLDGPRVREGMTARVLEDLAWLGLDWDEGPDRAGPFAPYLQSGRLGLYEAAFERLRTAGHLYPCFCRRKEIAAAASAPQEPGDEARYPGNCRKLAAEAAAERVAGGERFAWRFRVESAAPPFDDLVHGQVVPERGGTAGDFVVRRSDGLYAYQLAVVVDDAAMAIDEVVRGDDLLDSTGRQLLLYEALGLRAPRFGHVPLLRGPDGARLSKRHRGITVRELREAGFQPREIIGRLAQLLGLRESASAIGASELIEGFHLAAVPIAPAGRTVDVARWR